MQAACIHPVCVLRMCVFLKTILWKHSSSSCIAKTLLCKHSPNSCLSCICFMCSIHKSNYFRTARSNLTRKMCTAEHTILQKNTLQKHWATRRLQPRSLGVACFIVAHCVIIMPVFIKSSSSHSKPYHVMLFMFQWTAQ